jgi:hypothetical protein
LSSPFISVDGPFVFSGNAPGAAWGDVTGGDGGGGDVTPFWLLPSTSMEPLALSALAIAADKRRSSSGGRLSGCELRSSFSFLLSFFTGDPLLLMYAPGEMFDCIDLSRFASFLRSKENGAIQVALCNFSSVDGVLTFAESRASSSRTTRTPGMRFSLCCCARYCWSSLILRDAHQS